MQKWRCIAAHSGHAPFGFLSFSFFLLRFAFDYETTGTPRDNHQAR
jgi:hypothetical protein